MNSIIIVDTNVILRLILADDPKLSLRAKEIFSLAEAGQNRIYIDEVTVAEIVWVLSSFYRQSKTDIVRSLKDMVSQTWIINPRKKLILTALDLFLKTNLSYIDAWILSVSKRRKIELKTFDKKLGKRQSGNSP